MANVRNQNTFYIDSVSDSGVAGSWVESKGVRVYGIIFTSSAAADSITLADLSATSTAAGSLKVVVKNLNATDTKFIDLHDRPLTFPNGIWVNALSTGAGATLIIETNG